MHQAVGYDASAGRVARIVRLVALASVAVFTFERDRIDGSSSLRMLGAAATLLILSTLVSLIGSRYRDRPWSRRLTDVELALDSAYAIADAAFAIPVIGYVALGVPLLAVPIEAGFRRGRRGGVAVGLGVAAGVIGGRLLLPGLFLDGPLQASDIAPVLIAPPLLGLLLGSAVAARQRAVDQLAAANEELRDALRWQQDLLSFAAHEVKSPLTSTVGALGLLSERGDELSDDERREFLRMAESSAMRSAATADDLLGRARVAAGALTPTLQRTDVTDLVLGLVEIEQRTGQDVRRRVAPDVELTTDPAFLRHALTNLLSNAAKYGAAPVTVTLQHRDRGGATLTVSDRGEGVPDEFVPELFDSFTRAAGTRSEGTGVGLNVVKRMVGALGGSVTYRAGVDGGAEFVVVIPDGAR